MMKILSALSIFFCLSSFAAEILYVDRMNYYYRNALGGRNDIYYYLPSRTFFGKGKKLGIEGSSGLKIIYDKRNSGGRYKGGICGFITAVKVPPQGYLNLKPYKFISFWIRGEVGGENLNIGIADREHFAKGSTYRSLPINRYVPDGRITSKWKQAFVPMEYFKVNWSEIETITINFDSYVFENGEGEGVIYLDDLAFYSELPSGEEQKGYPHFP